MTQANKTRAERARAALADYLEDDLQTALIDLLTDALHLARLDKEVVDLEKAIFMSKMHYRDEEMYP